MSCDNCHHDLAGGKWRQVRGYRYRAGQPAWSPTRWVVLRHLVDAVAPAERAGLDADVERVAVAVSQLNPSQAVRESAENAAASLARVASRIEGASSTRRACAGSSPPWRRTARRSVRPTARAPNRWRWRCSRWSPTLPSVSRG